MANRKTHDALATVGTYTDRQTGQEKKRRIKVGTVFTDDQGRVSMKVDCMPLGNEWSGWINFYPVQQQSQPMPELPTEEAETPF